MMFCVKLLTTSFKPVQQNSQRIFLGFFFFIPFFLLFSTKFKVIRVRREGEGARNSLLAKLIASGFFNLFTSASFVSLFPKLEDFLYGFDIFSCKVTCYPSVQLWIFCLHR